jgi:hypothetical protein
MPYYTLTYNPSVIDRHAYFDFSSAIAHRVIGERLTREFDGSMFGLVFPIINHVLFMDTLDLPYRPINGRIAIELILSSACVLVDLLIAPTFGTESADDAYMD